MVRTTWRLTLLSLLLGYMFCYAVKAEFYHSSLQSIHSPAVSDTTGRSDHRYYAVKLRPGIKKAGLESGELKVITHINEETIIVRAKPNEINRKKAFFKNVSVPDPLWKISPSVKHSQIKGKSFFTIKLLDNASRASLSSLPDAEIISSSGNTFIVHCSLSTIMKSVINADDVIYIGLESTDAQTEGRVLDMNLAPNTINRIHHSFPDLNGEDMTISIKEQKYDTEDIDLQGRDVPSTLSSSVISDHATQMATIAAGAGNTFITGRGVAKAALLTSSDFQNVSPDSDAAYATLDVSVQNHAYGTVIENFYGTLAESFDLSANRNPHLLHIFSSGNKGFEASTSGPYSGIPGFANMTGNFKMAKNMLIVGAADTVGRAVALSSRGPAYDGRVKPELVAYSSAGTSNSAALVSGVALLLQQSYKEKNSALPASALIKSLLINSAADVGPTGIDFITGYGNVDGYRALINMEQENYFLGSINHLQVLNFTLPVPANAINLKITLAWNDPAAPVNSSAALVNDLDMTLSNNLGTTWLPWVLDASADAPKLQQPAVRNPDHRNNIEQITVNAPPAGTYTISVSGFDIPKGPQQFYVAYQWDQSNTFEWSYPTGNDNMPYNGETGSYFFWKSMQPELSGRLEYTTDNGTTWTLIADQVNLSKGYYRWDAPFITAAAKARMIAGSNIFVTDQFTISRPQKITVGFNCEDSVLMQWNAIPGAERYELYTFNELYLEPFLNTTDTAVILNTSGLSSRLYAVQPVLPGDIKTLRSQTIDYGELNATCYLSSLITTVVPEEGMYLTAQLGTVYAVDHVSFERKKGNTFNEIGLVTDPQDPMVTTLDDHPQQGLNIYRARIRLSNGSEIVSDTVEGYYLTTLPFVVFPNPVKSTGELQIFSKEFIDQDIVFRLYRSDGARMMQYQLLSDRESVPLNNIPPGFYFYSIESEEGFFSGKLIVRP